ncbi:MAG TPA: SDR family oxidoreductase [Allosphingosinicella sp.]|jgi:gluconate 5-dehydrogenase|nr:SDR family oxidoreductase [Allosphingosinicella sp.]
MAGLAGHALVVGASSGIGRAVAERLAPKMAVTALARRAERLESLAPLGVEAIACDVSRADLLEQAVQKAVERSGKISCLVYCAGQQKIKPLRLMKPAEVSELLRINLEAPLILAGLFTSRRVTTDDAVFCAVSSIAAARPEPGIVAYAAAKAGLDAMVKGLAREAAPRRAVAVAPGWLDTEMTQAYASLYDSEFRAGLEKSSPRGIATVEAVVDCIEFLLSPAAGYITGEVVRVDGGAAL